MLLIQWNQAMTAGEGRSGTRYAISRGLFAPSDPRPTWIVSVNDERFSSATSEQDAVLHSERLEALRCFLHGLKSEMSEVQLENARIVVSEMAQAADRTLKEADLGRAQTESVQQSRMALRMLYAQIAMEQQSRDPSNPPPTVH